VLIDRHHRLSDGNRVRLRLPHVRDAAELAGLAGEDELTVRRWLRADVAVCALAWDGAHDRLVGFGHLAGRGERHVLAPHPEVAALVLRGLTERAVSRRVA